MPPVDGGPFGPQEPQEPYRPQGAQRRGAKRQRVQSDMPRLAQIRHKKRMRRLRWLCVCVVFLAAVLAYFTGLYGASASVLGDKFDTLRALFSEGQEFPFAVRAQGLQNAQPLGGGFAMLTDNELSIYAANGALLRTVPHSYARPAMAAGSTRLCLYHRGGTSLSVESRSRTLWEYSAQSAIELCAMSPGGTLAIAQRGQVSVYTPMFEEIFTFYTSEHVTAMAFAGDNKHFAVGCPGSENGALSGRVYLFTTDPGAEADADAVLENPDGMPLKIFYPSASRVVVVYDNYMALYDAQEGSELARFDYGGLPVQSASMGGSGNIALLFGDGEHSAQTRVVLFDSGLNVTGQASVGARTFSVTAGRREAYVLAAGGVYCYGPDGTLWGTRQTENRPLAVVAAKKTVLLTAASASELQFDATQESGAAGGGQAASSGAPPASAHSESG